jgi:hypothetical protein
MRIKQRLLICGVICVSCATAFAVQDTADAVPSAKHKAISCGSVLDGRIVRLVVPEHMFTQTPKWDPAAGGQPPVAFRKVMVLTTKHVAQLKKETGYFALDSIALQNAHDGDWVYVVKYAVTHWEDRAPYKRMIADGLWDSTKPPKYCLLVLLDGTVVTDRNEDNATTQSVEEKVEQAPERDRVPAAR